MENNEAIRRGSSRGREANIVFFRVTEMSTARARQTKKKNKKLFRHTNRAENIAQSPSSQRRFDIVVLSAARRAACTVRGLRKFGCNDSIVVAEEVYFREKMAPRTRGRERETRDATRTRL